MEAASFKKALRQRQELLGPDADPAEVGDAAFLEVAESQDHAHVRKRPGTNSVRYMHRTKTMRNKRTQPSPNQGPSSG